MQQYQKDEKVGLGMIIRDSVGDVMMTAGRRMDGVLPMVQDEARALLFGLKYTFDAGLRKLVVETDCKALLSLVKASSKDNTST